MPKKEYLESDRLYIQVRYGIASTTCFALAVLCAFGCHKFIYVQKLSFAFFSVIGVMLIFLGTALIGGCFFHPDTKWAKSAAKITKDAGPSDLGEAIFMALLQFLLALIAVPITLCLRYFGVKGYPHKQRNKKST